MYYTSDANASNARCMVPGTAYTAYPGTDIGPDALEIRRPTLHGNDICKGVLGIKDR